MFKGLKTDDIDARLRFLVGFIFSVGFLFMIVNLMIGLVWRDYSAQQEMSQMDQKLSDLASNILTFMAGGLVGVLTTSGVAMAAMKKSGEKKDGSAVEAVDEWADESQDEWADEWVDGEGEDSEDQRY